MPRKQNQDLWTLYIAAEKAAKKRSNGATDEADLLEKFAASITIDTQAQQFKEAKEFIDRFTKPKATEATGQVTFDFMYDYEPDRLVRGDDGGIIRQDKAPVDYKLAEARRADKHVGEAVHWAQIKHTESGAFSQWVIEQLKEGRTKKLTFGDFVRETGRFKPFEKSNAA